MRSVQAVKLEALLLERTGMIPQCMYPIGSLGTHTSVPTQEQRNLRIHVRYHNSRLSGLGSLSLPRYVFGRG